MTLKFACCLIYLKVAEVLEVVGCMFLVCEELYVTADQLSVSPSHDLASK